MTDETNDTGEILSDQTIAGLHIWIGTNARDGETRQAIWVNPSGKDNRERTLWFDTFRAYATTSDNPMVRGAMGGMILSEKCLVPEIIIGRYAQLNEMQRDALNALIALMNVTFVWIGEPPYKKG